MSKQAAYQNIAKVVEHAERVRAKVNAFRGNERLRKVLGQASGRLGVAVLLPLIDSSAKWSSSLDMLERDWQLRASFSEVATTLPGTPHVQRPLADYELSRQVAGVLRPFLHATAVLQGSQSYASIYLPCMAATRKQLAEDASILLAGMAQPSELVRISEDDLQPACRALRSKLRQELEANYRHVQCCESLLMEASAMDPRFRQLVFLT